MNVGIVAQRGNTRALSLAVELAAQLRAVDVTPLFDRTTASALAEAEGRWPDGHGPPPTGVTVEEMTDCELVVSIGGDGTFLYAARGAGTTPIMGVNLGEVGFLNAVSPDDAVDAVLAEVEQIRETGGPRTRAMPRLRATGEDWSLAPAINEVVIQGSRRGHGGGAGFEVRVDGSLYTSGHADGVLVATPTGSTAYNLSEGGPLVHPAVDALVVGEMAGAEAMPPLTVREDSVVDVHIEDATEGVVVSDGRVRRAVEPPQRVRLSRADDPVHIAGPSRDFFAALGKLG